MCPFYLNFAKYDQKKKPSTPPLNEPPIDKDSVDHPGEGSGAGQKSLSQNDYIDHKKWLALVEENEDVAEDIQLKKKIAKAKVLVEAYIKLVKEEPLSLEEKMSYISNLLDEKLE